jgi:AcrR family transcriptional regulator
MSIDQDLRVTRTRTLVKDAFVKLMEEKEFQNITINDIADKAMINRSTFYLHFTDKYDLLKKITDEAIQSILDLVAPETHIVNGSLDYDSFFQNLSCILKVVEKDAKLYKIILNNKDMSGGCRELEDTLKNKLDTCFTGQVQISRDLFLELTASLYISSVRWWLNNDMIYTPSFLAKELVKYLSAASCSLMGISSHSNK